MAELSTKIKKKVYSFELKKKYQYLGHYKIKTRPPIERIKDSFRAMLKPKKEAKKAAAVTVSEPPKGGFNFMVFGAFIFIALIILGMAWLYLTTQLIPPGSGFLQPPVDKAMIYNTLESGEVMTSGSRGSSSYLGAVLVDYETSNLNNYSINLTAYDNKIPSEVFILNSERIEATTYPDFISSLRANLAKRKIILNEITLKQLETVPEGALVIVPSGAIPKEILGIESPMNMNKLAQRGVVILYIGQPFTKMLNGTLVAFTPKETLQNLPVKFDESSPVSSSDGFHLFQPLYRTVPGGGWLSGQAYGSVSIVKSGDGAFIFLPQTLDGGWRGNYTSAAEDVSRIVFEVPWAKPSADSKEYLFVNQTNYNGSRYLFSEPFESPKATVRVDFTGYSATSNNPIKETLYIRVEKQTNNSLLIEEGGRVVSANITNLPVRMNAQLREPQAAQPNMYLIVYDSNGTEIQTFPQGNLNVQADSSFDVLIYLDRGEYLVKLVDDESRVYAQTYMKVVSIDITYTGNEQQRRSVYRFDITMDGTPKLLSEISVKVDGGQYGSYTFNNVDKIKIDVNQYTGGELLPLGKHSFEFTAGGLKVSVPVNHTRPKTLFDEPFFWITLLLTGGVVGVGVIFARQDEVFFSIDIPDFPPIARTKIPLTSDTVLSIFEKVNENYRWQSTPLTTPEVKNGFKEIFYQGKPVYITDYNVEFLLDDLEKKGLVRESLGYYGLTSWQQKSRRTVEYLALMRRLRDICVNNAIPFTGLGESKEADSEITVVGQQMSLHFYEKNMNSAALLARVIPTIGHGIAIIIFKSASDKEQFQTLINSSPTIGPLIVKMEFDSSSLLLLTADELEKMLIEFKSM
jgi:predicted regulator of amino acid metabolism with ACT domain